MEAGQGLALPREADRLLAVDQRPERLAAMHAGEVAQERLVAGGRGARRGEERQLLLGQPRGGQVADLVATLEAGGKQNVASVLAEAHGDIWHFTREPARRTAR